MHPRLIAGARLPRWAAGADWPVSAGGVALADLHLDAGRFVRATPASARDAHATAAVGRAADAVWNVDGAPVLPGLVDAHAHLDKTFTRDRAPPLRPGLLGAIEAMHRDRVGWTAEDVRARAACALAWAEAAGVVHLRTHVDWWEADRVPLAWHVLAELAQDWRGRIALERVALVPLTLYADADVADRLAGHVREGGAGACLGGFVHTVNWNAAALAHLFDAAARHDLDVDLHVDEELSPAACGLATTAALVRERGFGGRVVCGHACALSAQDEATAAATLDAVARAGITLVSLPATNLLLQDAVPGRTPRRRGITLVKEARARGIPVLVASDNVQDAFCTTGAYDPIEALQLAVLAAQLDEPFDDASQLVCRVDALARARAGAAAPFAADSAADLVVFAQTRAGAWPARAQERVVLRAGRVVAGTVPGAWHHAAPHPLDRDAA